MRFSIITITYNAEAYLQESLESVASQQFEDFEHVVWDGGSQDRTLQIVQEFPKIVVYQGRDRGISDAMNQGAFRAKGDFILHLHADDRLAGPHVLTCVDAFLRLHPKVEWLYGIAHTIDARGIRIETGSLKPYRKSRLRKYNFLPHPATFLSRPIFQKSGGFRDEFRYCMDYELWLRLSKKYDAHALPFHIADFRAHEKSCSTSNPLQVADEAYLIRNQYVTSLWERWKSYQTWRKRRASVLQKTTTDSS